MNKTVWVVVGLIILLSAGQTFAGAVSEQLDVTFSERFRLVTWDNTISLDDSSNEARTFTRHRTYLGATWKPDKGLHLRLQLGNEFRYHVVPTYTDFTLNEIFIDQLYVKLIKPGNLPVTATLGRQNIMLGEGFVVMDGSPLDGSRSMYFNAVRLDWDLGKDRTLTTFGFLQRKTDDILPVVNEQDQALLEFNSDGFGAYLTLPIGRQSLECYYIQMFQGRREDLTPWTPTVRTIGTRASLQPAIGHSFVVEGAYQFRTGALVSGTALGFHAHYDLECRKPGQVVAVPEQVRLGGIYLSGDDPTTSDYEGWDPVFGRWPKWSESYIYTQLRENGVAWWTNLASLYLGSIWQFSEKVQFRADYHHLMAPQEPGYTASFSPGPGSTRGDLFIGKLIYSFDQHWSGHVLWEGFLPGDFYPSGADGYSWIRTELMFQF